MNGMNQDLLETKQIIGKRYKQPNPMVFLYLDDYLWKDDIKLHFRQLRKEGYIITPVYNDLGVEIALTLKGREFLDACPREEWPDDFENVYQQPVTTITRVAKTVTLIVTE